MEGILLKIEKELNKKRYAQRDNSVPLKERIISWPRMGNIDLFLTALVGG